MLVFVVVCEQLLHDFEVCFQFGACFDDVVPEIDGYGDLVSSFIDFGLLLGGLARLAYLSELEVELVAREADLLELLKGAHLVQGVLGFATF